MNGDAGNLFSTAIVFASVFCIGMGLVTVYHQWVTRPPLGMAVMVTVLGVLILIGLVADSVYRSPAPVVIEPRSVLYLAGLGVTSAGLVLLTVATRAQVAMRDLLGEDEYYRLRTLRRRKKAAAPE